MMQYRHAGPEDEPLLFEIYAGTRRDEVAAWGWAAAQQEAFLRMQFTAQRLSYRAQYPGADDRIILREGIPVGRIMTALTDHAIALVDIAILPGFRGSGIGTALIRDLQARAASAGLAVTLHVLKINPARRLYERLGFVPHGESELRLAMQWRPGANPDPGPLPQ